jgi:alkylation response protein AidB-like acyl-CoA dehydrogenase
MLGNFDILDGEERRIAPDGSFKLRRAFFPTSECSIIDTWDMTGMRGTGSHDWTVTDQFIPQNRTVEVPGRLTFNQWSRWRGPFYALPVHALIGPHHSVDATGIGRAAIDALTELAGAKVPRGRQGLLRDQPHIQDAVARAEGILGAGQAYREVVARDIWATVSSGEETTLEQRARCRLAASFAVDSARQAMDLMYRAGGTTSSKRTHRLAHCWRDLQVVGQAASVAPEWYVLSGKVLLGLEPGPRLI